MSNRVVQQNILQQYSVLLLALCGEPCRITGGPLEPEAYVSSHSLEDSELKVSVCVCYYRHPTPFVAHLFLCMQQPEAVMCV